MLCPSVHRYSSGIEQVVPAWHAGDRRHCLLRYRLHRHRWDRAWLAGVWRVMLLLHRLLLRPRRACAAEPVERIKDWWWLTRWNDAWNRIKLLSRRLINEADWADCTADILNTPTDDSASSYIPTIRLIASLQSLFASFVSLPIQLML